MTTEAESVYYFFVPPPPPTLGTPLRPKLLLGARIRAADVATFAARISARRTLFAGGSGFGNVVAIDSSVTRLPEACAWTREVAEAYRKQGIVRRIRRHGRRVDMRGTADNERGDAYCAFVIGFLADVRCAMSVLRGGRVQRTLVTIGLSVCTLTSRVRIWVRGWVHLGTSVVPIHGRLGVGLTSIDTSVSCVPVLPHQILRHLARCVRGASANRDPGAFLETPTRAAPSS